MLTDESATVTDRYTYAAFGELLEHTGPDPQADLVWQAGNRFNIGLDKSNNIYLVSVNKGGVVIDTGIKWFAGI